MGARGGQGVGGSEGQRNASKSARGIGAERMTLEWKEHTLGGLGRVGGKRWGEALRRQRQHSPILNHPSHDLETFKRTHRSDRVSLDHDVALGE